MDKYIPVPEENFFLDYLEIEAKRKIITRGDLDSDPTLNTIVKNNILNYQTLVVPSIIDNTELNLTKELYQKILQIKNTFEFPDETGLNNLLDSIKQREYDLDVSENIQELSEIYVYNQNNRFNKRPFKYSTKKHRSIDKKATIDVRMFQLGNLNLNYYAVLNTKFIHKAYIQKYNCTLPYGIFWCKLDKYTSKKNTTILDNCKNIYFYHIIISGKPILYSYIFNDQKIYFASNNFVYEYRVYNDKEALVLLHTNNKFMVYDKVTL